MNKDIVVGIDTSNYTTSVALLSENGELIANIKRPLPVALGQRGLRQSDAVFAHIKNLPSAMKEAENFLQGCRVVAVGVSERPRNIDGSYMPCFLAGVSSASSICAAAGAKLYKFSHQCGHIMAAIYSSGNISLLNKEFAAFHISGGTTELIKVSGSSYLGFAAELVGGTRDLNAGQVIDRIGVHMGLPFPCGPHLEKLALSNAEKIPAKKISISGLEVNLSGLENLAMKLYRESGDRSLVSAFVLDYIANAIIAMSDAYVEKYGKSHFVYAGGVMSNSIIRKKLSSRFDCSFAEPSMSSDNAVGIAYLAARAYCADKNR